MGVRIQKVLSEKGIASRRKIESLIKEGKIKVNNRTAVLGQPISNSDKVTIEGKSIRISDNQEPIRVLIYNKKVGEICSNNDPQGRSKVFDSLPSINSGRWISIGRLDINTSGLLLFSNNGSIANKLMHPSSNIEREYIARVHGKVDQTSINNLLTGVYLDDGLAKFTDVQMGRHGATNYWFAMVIKEGRSREVRRLWESQGFEISRLKRVRFGGLFLPANLKKGSWKELNKEEMKKINNNIKFS